MKYILKDKLDYFRTYLGQTVLYLFEGAPLHTVTEETIAQAGFGSFLSLRSVESMSAKESEAFYLQHSPGTTTTHEKRMMWASTIARDLSAPAFSDGYQHLISKGFLVPHESRSINLLVKMGWAKEIPYKQRKSK